MPAKFDSKKKIFDGEMNGWCRETACLENFESDLVVLFVESLYLGSQLIIFLQHALQAVCLHSLPFRFFALKF
jgi:hypothetical protein